jgi:hypothetical protein
MAKKKLFADIRQNPARFYRVPGDVLRDRRFDDAERICILKAWAEADDVHTAEITAALVQLDSSGVHHAAE